MLLILKHSQILYKLSTDLGGFYFLVWKCGHLQYKTEQMSPCRVWNWTVGQDALLTHPAIGRKREEQRKQTVIIWFGIWPRHYGWHSCSFVRLPWNVILLHVLQLIGKTGVSMVRPWRLGKFGFFGGSRKIFSSGKSTVEVSATHTRYTFLVFLPPSIPSLVFSASFMLWPLSWLM